MFLVELSGADDVELTTITCGGGDKKKNIASFYLHPLKSSKVSLFLCGYN